MGFDINGFKNAFLNQLHQVSNMVSQDNKINAAGEVSAAKHVVSAFKSQLSNVSDSIGDTVSFSKKPEEVTLDELLEFVDPSIAAKVNHYAVTKPVETIVSNKVTPTLANTMAEMTEDLDVDKLNAFLDMAYRSEDAERIAENVEQSPEDMKTGYYVGLAYENA